MALRASNQANLDTSTAPSRQRKGNSKTIEQTFTKLSQLEHVLLRPDTYIGSAEPMKQQAWVWDDTESRMKYKDVVYAPGLYKIFDEILVNAADHKQRDPSMNCIRVEIDTENQLISVWNNGSGIPVEIHQKEKIYVPELIFGNLLTSSNYDDDEKKVVGGRNGFGAKLANIFSTEFTIETADSQRGKKYKQTFRNNMSNKGEPIIRANPKKESYTKISFSPDLERFGMTHLDDDIVSLLKKRVYDIAGVNSSLKVYLNGSRLPIRTFKDYVKYYSKDESTAQVFHVPLSGRWEVAVAASDGQLTQMSFVNSIWTIKGGTHVTHVADQCVSKISEHIAKKNKGMKVKPFQIKNHLALYINCLIENPSFDSQTKETLTTKPGKFGSKWTFPDELAKKVIKDSGIVENVLAFAKFKESKELAKTDGGKKARVHGIPKLADANKAGSREASKCTLILTEGDSAKALAISGLSVVGRDYFGVFPLRGKLLNVREAKHKQIMDNAEIKNLKKILGLQHNKSYDADSVKSLRYGHVLVMADQDHDGSHIKGLVINFFDHFWPSLLKVEGFLQEFITPIVKCTKGKNDKVFFTLPEYKRWVSGGEASGWKPKYYKGLGTSTAAEAKNYFSNLPRHLHEFYHAGNQDSDCIELAFSKQRVNDRKDWLAAFTPGTYFDHEVDELNYSNFVNKELILFSVADNARSIPSVIDGLKPSQRKVLFACFKRKLTKSEIKVAQLAGYVAEHAAYHHGEMSLQSTIVGLAQNFVGSNNLNMLVPAGQFGTRLQGGKDAASSRYIFTKLAPITRALFPELDDPLLSFLEEDGLSIEPHWYCPIIPTVLVNGSDGIGTGWSSFVPCFNPRDLIANIRRKLRDEPIKPMLPWYRGFRGSIVPVDNSKSFDVYGVLKRDSDDSSFKVDELPIRSWTTPYKEFLESNIVGNSDTKAPFIKEIQDNSTENKVNFKFSVASDFTKELSGPSAYKRLKLQGSVTTSNMVLFDSEGRIKKYETPEEIVEEFFTIRLDLYEKRKEHLLAELTKDLLCLSNKQRFIVMVVEGKLIVAKRKKTELLSELKRLRFDAILKSGNPGIVEDGHNSEDEDHSEDNDSSAQSKSSLEKGYDYLLSMPLWSLTMEKVQQLAGQRDRKAAEKSAMEKTIPAQLWEDDLKRLEDALTKDEADAVAMSEDLERVAREARARQAGRGGGKRRKGKLPKSFVNEDDDLQGSFEEVPIPSARSVALKKAKAKSAGVGEVRKPLGGKSKEPAASTKKAAAKRNSPLLLEDSESDQIFSEYSDDDGTLELVDDDSLDDGIGASGDSRPRQNRDNTELLLHSSEPEDESEFLGNPPTAKPATNRRNRKVPARIVESDSDDSPEEENGGLDGTDSEKETLSLSQRLAQRLKLSEASAPSKAPRRNPVKKSVLKAPLPIDTPAGTQSKRQRDAKTKAASSKQEVVSPSPSPKSKKTRVRSPNKPNPVKGGKRRKGAKKVVETDEDSEKDSDIENVVVPVAATTRPRRQRAVKKVVIIDSDDEDVDLVASDDDDDSDFE